MRCEYDNDNLKQFIRRVQMHKRSPSPTPVVPSANAPVVSGSGAALATVVGVLVEVPVMLSVCHVCNRSRGWYQLRVKPETR